MFKKNIAITFLIIFTINLIGIFFILAPLSNVLAVEFTPQVEIGDFKEGTSYTVGDDTEMIGAYIKSIYEYAVGIVGIIAAVVLMFGGVLYLTAGGSAEKITNAKSWIGASLTGLVLVLSSYLLLSLINPDLVNFKIQDIETVDTGDDGKKEKNPVGCCEYVNPPQAIMETEKECKDDTDATWKGINFVKDKTFNKCTKLLCCLTYNAASKTNQSCNDMTDYACKTKGGTSKSGTCLDPYTCN